MNYYYKVYWRIIRKPIDKIIILNIILNSKIVFRVQLLLYMFNIKF